MIALRIGPSMTIMMNNGNKKTGLYGRHCYSTAKRLYPITNPSGITEPFLTTTIPSFTVYNE